MVLFQRYSKTLNHQGLYVYQTYTVRKMSCISWQITILHLITVFSKTTMEKTNISGVLTDISQWSVRGDEDLGILGAQTDLLIDRKDGAINLCEMESSVNESVSNKEYDMALRNRPGTFRQVAGSRKTLQMTMTTTYGVRPGKYSGMISNQVNPDDLFHE